MEFDNIFSKTSNVIFVLSKGLLSIDFFKLWCVLSKEIKQSISRVSILLWLLSDGSFFQSY